ncbi:TIGR04197 family type VII secretion effector [Heyndrickxia acidiproducens]|jgi:type VII secretion effector (TIGR04197 family)|uniref:TIGR04197 family type VII secretion effector n=1 Tax=Heyndrickxia acidiproducens TaxID=1121084 RepID=UPI00035E18B4|nr:TIGR04197 family type VII secretion effector [Heyndrickxia acidiproducens]
MGEIAINQTVFQAALNQAESARSALEGVKPAKPALHQTDLKSMKEQLEVLENLQKAFEKYSALLDADLRKLEKLGEEMVQRDESIGHSFQKPKD